MKLYSNTIKLALAVGLTMGALPHVYAAGTTAGTTVSNTATVDYEVGGVNQPDKTSNTLDFKVDRKVNMTVAEVGSAVTPVGPGATGKVSTFTVTNNSNSIQDFALAATQQVGGAAVFTAENDTFQVTVTGIFVESGVTAGYQVLEDTATFIDELAADDVKTVYVISTIPFVNAAAVALSDTDNADITLTATAHGDTVALTGVYAATATTLGAVSAETNTGVVDDTTFIDTVFGDVAGDTDAAQDGKHSDDDTYAVVTAAIAVTKSSTVVSDPFNGTTNPKSIPGAVIEYCLDINNTGSGDADAIVLSDQIPTNTTFVTNSIKSAATGTGTACDLDSGVTEDNDDSDGGEVDGATGDFDVTQTNYVTVRKTSIAGGSRFKAIFRVTVD